MKCEDLYRGIGGIDEKWLALADEPEKEKESGGFVGYELQKLLGIRYVWIFLAVFLLLNSFLAYMTAVRTEAAQIPRETVVRFLDEYQKNPEPYDTYYQNLLCDPDGAKAHLYSGSEDFSDMALLEIVYSAMRAEAEHEQKLDTVIENARRNLKDFQTMGISENAYAYRYQRYVVEAYTGIKEAVVLDAEYRYGWNEYFSYEPTGVFIFFMALIFGCVIFMNEKQSRFLPILRASKHGHAKTAVAKILTLLLLTLFTTLLFVFSAWAVYGVVIGFSSPTADLQALPLFTLSANEMSIGAYFFVNILMKFLCAALFGFAVLASSVLLGNYILVYASGISLLGCNLFLYLFPWLSAEHPLRHLNLAAVSVGTPVFNRFRSVNLFGNVAEYIPVLLVTFMVLSALLLSLCIWRYAQSGVSSVYPAWLSAAVGFVLQKSEKYRHPFSFKKKEKFFRVRGFSMSLVGTELYKTLVSSRLIFVVLLLVCLKIFYAADVNTESTSNAHRFYAEYMHTLEGELTEEKLVYLQEERAMIDRAISLKDAMENAYSAEEITWEEYSAYLKTYTYAVSHDYPLVRAETEASYLLSLEEKTGIKGWFFYSDGWERLYTGEADLFLYMSLLILLAGTFAAEHFSVGTDGAVIQILRTMKKGRSHTFGAKIISSLLIAFVLSLGFNLIDCVTVFQRFDMPATSAPLASMPIFENVSSSLTVGGYLAVFLLLRIAAALIMAMLVCALSELLCRYIPILGTVVLLTLLPAVCVYFGIAAAQKINFLNLFAGTPIILHSAEYAWLGSEWTMLTIWISLVGITTTLLLSAARRRFVK